MVQIFRFREIDGFQGLPAMKLFLLGFFSIQILRLVSLLAKIIAVGRRKLLDRFSYLWMWRQF